MTSHQTTRGARARRTTLCLAATGALLSGGLATAHGAPAPTVDAPGYTHLRVADGVVYTSPSGQHRVADGYIGDLHEDHGGGGGQLGYPVTSEHAPGAGYWYQSFERGVIYAGRPGTFDVNDGPVRALHQRTGGGTGTLGYPTGHEVQQGARHWFQTFERGVIHSSPSGTHVVDGPIRDAHRAHGGGTGVLGYPTSGAVGQGGSYRYQSYERGVIYSSTAGTHVVTGSVAALHSSTGGGAGRLGYPTSSFVGQGGSYGFQAFERGTVYTSPAGTHAVNAGSLGSFHAAQGGGGGALGYPTAGETSSGGTWRQTFERGTVTVTNGVASLETSGSRMLGVALQQLGDRYASGGTGPDAFDCSGLVYYSYGQIGIQAPRTTKSLWSGSQRVGQSELQPGDLIFYGNGGPAGIYHVAIYAGDGMRVHAPSASRSVEHVPVLWANVVGYGRI